MGTAADSPDTVVHKVLEAFRWTLPRPTTGATSRSARKTITLAFLVFCIALGIRLLYWQDQAVDIETGRMMHGMTKTYAADAASLRAGDLRLFLTGPSPPVNAEVLKHTPGYPIFLALITILTGGEESSWRLGQIFADSLTIAILFLIGCELLPIGAAFFGGVLAGVSPQISSNALVLLPDSICLLPIMVGLYVIVRSLQAPTFWKLLSAGLLIGISCWLRPNALLLAPMLAVFLLFIFPAERRLRLSLAVILGALLLILPITIRNGIVFGRLIPLTIGVGTNLIEGIGDYGEVPEKGILKYDHTICQWEAERFSRPDYAFWLFSPDGIEREDERSQRARSFIKDHPLLYAKAVAMRVGWMLTLQSVPRIAPRSVVTSSVIGPASTPVQVQFSEVRDECGGRAGTCREASIDVVPWTQDMVIIDQAESEMTNALVLDASGRTVIASGVMDDHNGVIELPFTAGSNKIVKVVISYDGHEPSLMPPAAHHYDLGPDTNWWTRPFRWPIRVLQGVFTTAVILSLTVLGIAFLFLSGRKRGAALLLVLPVYYLIGQAPIHTEYRYIVMIHYFSSMIAGLSLYTLVLTGKQLITSR